eukprot:SAG31_NODE_3146_length_4620_cov_7.206591_1_plen_120_part_00
MDLKHFGLTVAFHAPFLIIPILLLKDLMSEDAKNWKCADPEPPHADLVTELVVPATIYAYTSLAAGIGIPLLALLLHLMSCETCERAAFVTGEGLAGCTNIVVYVWFCVATFGACHDHD